MLKHRGVEQLAARRAHNPEVVSSSLTPATKNELFRDIYTVSHSVIKYHEILKILPFVVVLFFYSFYIVLQNIIQ